MKKTMKKKLVSYAAYLSAIAILGVLGVLGVGLVINAYQGGSPKYVAEGDLIVNEVPEAPVVQQEEAITGAFPGTDIYQAVRFASGFANRVLTTSTNLAAHTLSEKDLQNDIIEYTVLLDDGFALTFPATSTLSSILPAPGDSKRWTIRNNSTSTSDTVITLTAGTGWEFTGVDTNVDTIAAAGWAQMDCYRLSASSTYAEVDTSNASNIMCNIQELIAVD